MIIDYSYWRPNPVTDLHGVNGVIRYISHDVKKAASAAEIGMLHVAGIATALVFEDDAKRPEQGHDAGTADGEFTATQLRLLQVPPNRPIYVACDFAPVNYAPASTNPAEELGPVGDYLRAFRAALHTDLYTMGVYGAYGLCSRVMAAGITHRVWQTAAWSSGSLVADACLYQPGISWHNGSADLDLAGWRDWGQFRRETAVLTGARA